MIKKIVPPIILCLFMLSISTAQDPVCLPDSTYADSLAGVYPGPYHPELYPDGGIQDTACINHPFEMVFTAVIRDTINYEGLQLKLNRITVKENGVLNLPVGLDYECNPPDCKFESNTMGCLVVSGTPEEADLTGIYDLKLLSEIVLVDGLITVVDTLPELLIPDSHYYLVVDEEDSANCQELNTYQHFVKDLGLEVLNNPVKNQLFVTFNLTQDEAWELHVIDFKGSLITRKSGIGGRTRELIHFNQSNLTGAQYVVRLVTSNGIAAKKVVILPR